MTAAATSTAAVPGFRRNMVTICAMTATIMQALDTTIANVALPTISGNLGVSSEQGTWVITSFAVSNAIALPLTGWLSRRFGEVKLFLWATILFVLASFLCGISTSMPELVGFRVLQGLVAGPFHISALQHFSRLNLIWQKCQFFNKIMSN